jgi:hypothetical protein
VTRAAFRHSPLAPAPPAGKFEWTERGLLDAATRRALGSINLAFLDLAAELAEEGHLRQIAGLPSRAIDALIDPVAGPRLCERLPFALFDYRFSDGDFWTAEIAAAAHAQNGGSRGTNDERASGFARAAITFIWHLAQSQAAAARLVFGASPTTIAAVAGMPVVAIERLANRVAPTLSARFGSRTRFWLQFEGYASRPDDWSLSLLRQLGLQIEGAESARNQSLQRHRRRGVA